jgi:uncharacterized membrane protein YfcA
MIRLTQSFCVFSIAVLLLLTAVTVSANAGQCSVPSQRVQCGSLTCDPETKQCRNCYNDDECYESAVQCVIPAGAKSGICQLKSLKQTFHDRPGNIVASGLVAVGVCAIGVVGGLGGGGMLVPLYEILMGVPLLNSVAMSQATIVGQASFSVLVWMFRYHPDYQPPARTRPATNWVLLTYWLPISLVGTMYGNVAGKVVPDWFRMTLLFLVLSYTLIRIILRIIAQRKADKEKKALLSDAAAGDFGDEGHKRNQHEESEPSMIRRIEGTDARMCDSNHSAAGGYGAVQTGESDADGSLDDEHGEGGPVLPQFPKMQIALILLVFVPLFVANYFKNNNTSCNSPAFWGIMAGISIWCMAIALSYFRHLARMHEQILLGELDAEQVPFKWNFQTTVTYPIAAFIAGGAASLLGTGGGLILSFLMYEAGLAPEEVSATSGLTTFLVAFESLLLFFVQKQMPYDYFLYFFGCGLFATLVGQFVLMAEIKRRGLRFLIVAALAFIMAGSMVSLSAVGIYDTVQLLHAGGSIGFGELCPVVHNAMPPPGNNSSAVNGTHGQP